VPAGGPTVAEAAVASLEALGVARVYGIIGTSILDFFDALYHARERLRLVTVRHEQVAVSAADAEGRVAGRLAAAAAVHAGPGILNAAIAVAIAFRDRAPLLLVSGGVRRRLRGTYAWLEVDQESVFKPITVHYEVLSDPGRVWEAFLEAAKRSMGAPRGPAVVEVPEDVWRQRAGGDDGLLEEMRSLSPPSRGLGGAAAGVLDSLARAERPVIMVCGEAVASPRFSQRDLLELAERTGAYIVVSGNARGACPEDHPRCLGRVGFGGGSIAADKAFEESDFLLVLGNEFDDTHTYAYTMIPQGDILVVSMDPAVKARPPYYEHLEADPGAALEELAGEARRRGVRVGKPSWDSRVAALREEWGAMLREALTRSYENAANPARFFSELDRALPRDRVIVGGQGVHIVYTYDFMRVYEPRSFLAATNLGAMSYALPAALGAKLARPESEVVAVVGDGDLMMTVQDLETAVRERIGVKVVVVNDYSYRVLYLRQVLQKQGRIHGTLLGNPDFVKLAESMGMEAFRVERDSDIRDGVRFLAESQGPALLEIVVDKGDIPPLNMEYTMRMSV
jgi:acetolactate synthase-1/2/3 large subunit